MLCHIKINNMDFQEDSSSTILQVCRKHGIKVPTLCYFVKEEANFEHKPASCRVCVVEVKGKRNLVPACSTNIYDGMEVSTNNARVRKERRIIVELLLSNHPHNCLTCDKCGKCELQDLASELGIRQFAFNGPLSQPDEDKIGRTFKRNASKCILCNRCTDVCDQIQSIAAISPSFRGFKTIISEPNACVYCGQCVQACPTGALMQIDDTKSIEKALNDPNKIVVVNTAPSCRVSLGEEFGLEPGTDVTGKMVTALRRVGFDYVFDTNFGADLTIMEEAKEFIGRLEKGGPFPMITSCCPGWINFLEIQYPELLYLPSSCKSPQEMFGSILKTYWAKKKNIDPSNIVNVSLMPCIAKKEELKREQLKVDGVQSTDYSMSVKEFGNMLRRFGIDFKTLEDGDFDQPLGESTGAADIFGNTGGVMEACLRTASTWLLNEFPKKVEFHGIFGIPNTKEAYIQMGEHKLHVCYVSGLASARKIIEQIKSGEVHYDVVEVMACPGGCINGGGQPVNYKLNSKEVMEKRKAGLRKIDQGKSVRISCESEAMKTLYKEFLGEPNSELAHHLLHTTFRDRS